MPATRLPTNEAPARDDSGTKGKAATSAFYVVANSNHFLGLVAMINSLRLVGHDEPIFVTDCGLTQNHRRRIADEVTLVDVATPDAPHLAKMVAPLAHPSGVMILIDADVIVTRPLTELIDCARSGRLVVFADNVAHRFDERWSKLLGLGPLRRQRYVNGGLVILPRTVGGSVLEQVAIHLPQVEVEHTIMGAGTPDYPFYYIDQDVLNAVLASRPSQQVEILDHALAPFPPFRGLKISDEATLRCVYEDGREPFALHHVLAKPWMAPMRSSAYSQLLSRLVLRPDVAIRLPRAEVPLRFRTGAASWLEKRRCDALWFLRELRVRVRLLARKHVGHAGARARRSSDRRK